MCGIVAASAERDVAALLLNGIKALEYRGYDSSGIALYAEGKLQRLRAVGKVAKLEALYAQQPLKGICGIAHTRWATHGAPTTANAHPHLSGNQIAVVHNGIIENYEQLRTELMDHGYCFETETDTESIAHLLHYLMSQGKDLLGAVIDARQRLRGAYGLAVQCSDEPGRIIGARSGSPLVVGIGIGEHFMASDVYALLAVTNRFVYLEEGDVVDLNRTSYAIYDVQGKPVQRLIHDTDFTLDSAEKGEYRHYMQKEIFEQASAVRATLDGRILEDSVPPEIFGEQAKVLLSQIEQVHIVACGTSYHAGLVASYWIETYAGLPCTVEVASEYRYRKVAVPNHTLFISVSQSGETADTLAALKVAKSNRYTAYLAICNVAESSLVRESNLILMTRAGPEIGVASTKAFTTQLIAFALLSWVLAKFQGLCSEKLSQLIAEIRSVPQKITRVLKQNSAIEKLANCFVDKNHALFLGRGAQYAIAMEGALKLKEISYIHAEAYPAGELKHGPLALVDEQMPVIAVAPKNELLEKLNSNLQVVRARGGELFVFADHECQEILDPAHDHLLELPSGGEISGPIIQTIPLQLLAYHVAVLKGTDVDQPRNLAKSVTVE